MRTACSCTFYGTTGQTTKKCRKHKGADVVELRAMTHAARRLRTLVFASALLAAAPLVAQTLSVQDAALKDWTSQQDTLMKIASAMPENAFGFRPTPAQRTWGEQILHIAQANVNQMGRLGAKAPAPEINMNATARTEILKALRDSFEFGTAALKEQTDATMLEQAANTRFDRFMGPSARVRVVYYVIGHTWDIYGQMVVYLRLNGITPPASQRF
jgi:uncharacterized damage-inducible protein DinB